jgi:hypothetical protein
MSYTKKFRRLLEVAKGDEFGAGVYDRNLSPLASVYDDEDEVSTPQSNPAAAKQAQVDTTKKAETDALAAAVTGQPKPQQAAPKLTTLVSGPKVKTPATRVADTRLERMKALRASRAKPGFLSKAANFAGAMMRKGAPLAKSAIQTGLKKGGEFLDKKGDQTAYGRVAGGAIGALAGGPLGAFAGQAIGGGLQNLASGMRKVYTQRKANIAADPALAQKTKGLLGMFRGYGAPIKQNIGQMAKGAYEAGLGALGARGIGGSSGAEVSPVSPDAEANPFPRARVAAPRFGGIRTSGEAID